MNLVASFFSPHIWGVPGSCFSMFFLYWTPLVKEFLFLYLNSRKAARQVCLRASCDSLIAFFSLSHSCSWDNLFVGSISFFGRPLVLWGESWSGVAAYWVFVRVSLLWGWGGGWLVGWFWFFGLYCLKVICSYCQLLLHIRVTRGPLQFSRLFLLRFRFIRLGRSQKSAF